MLVIVFLSGCGREHAEYQAGCMEMSFPGGGGASQEKSSVKETGRRAVRQWFLPRISEPSSEARSPRAPKP